MQEVGIFAEPVTIATNHINQPVFLLMVILPPVYTVERRRGLELLQNDLIVLHYTSHVLDTHCTVQRVVTV